MEMNVEDKHKMIALLRHHHQVVFILKNEDE